jgi:uncharacterized membrane protein
MDANVWAKMHGAATHFPIALVLCSGAFDLAAVVLRARPVGRDLQAAGYWTILGGAIGSVPAVFSGLAMTKGNVLGHDALRWHHLFVWPSFALVIALATWRAIVGARPHGATFVSYLAILACTIGLLLAAGYWGGELMMAG